MGNVIMKAQQITYGASNVEKALDDLKAPELIELNKRMDAIDAWKANVHEETYTGSELTIENALALPARSLITSIDAIQDLHGLPFPYVGGAYKNKCNIADAEIGTAWNGASNADRARLVIPCQANTQYTISINGTNSLDSIYVNDSATVPAAGSGDVFTTSKTFTTGASSAYIIVGFTKTNITQADVDVLLLQLELGDTATSYAPYSNECPISGRTEARVDTENEDSSESAYAVIQLGQTVYGADINWVTGVGTVLDAIADMGDLTWSYNSTSQVFNSSALPGATTENVYTDAISSSYKEHQTGMSAMVNGDFRVLDGVMTVKDTAYTDATAFKTAVTGQTVCYELATPITIQLTPTQLQMLKGYNRVTIESGSIELKALVLGGDN